MPQVTGCFSSDIGGRDRPALARMSFGSAGAAEGASIGRDIAPGPLIGVEFACAKTREGSPAGGAACGPAMGGDIDG
jgi:hypothetical protein